MTWLYKVSEINSYDVGISKMYFPKEIRPSGVQEFYQVIKIKASSRTDAATKVWQLYGTEWLKLMGPKQTSVRIVSLHVSSPKAGVGGILGRLYPIKVYSG